MGLLTSRCLDGKMTTHRLLMVRLLLFTVLLTSGVVCAQTRARCQNKPPTLRGFYLGETVDEIHKVIPHFRAAFDEKRVLESRPSFVTAKTEVGFTLVDSAHVFYPEPGVRRTPRSEYDDVDFFWHFLDEKLFFISVRYLEYEPRNLNEFIQQLAEKTNLPKQGWIFKDRNHAILSCVGFDVDVWTGRYVNRPEYRDYPSVMLTDTVLRAELDRREKALKLQRKKAELERLRREKQRHSILKP